MYKLTLKNKSGNTLEFNNIGGAFTIVEINGLNPADATINTSNMALIDGAKFNSSKVNMRTIDIAFVIEREPSKNRIEVYKVLKPKQPLEVAYKGDYRDVFIEGYVQSVNVDFFARKQQVTVSILCTSPYFKQAQEMVNELSAVISAFHFPFGISSPVPFSYLDNNASLTIRNDGDVETGLIIDIYARGTASNPKIYNYITQEYIGVNFDFVPGDLITIDTRQGKKSITLLRNGITSNQFNTLMNGSKWLQLEANESVFVGEASNGFANLEVIFRHNNLYEGV